MLSASMGLDVAVLLTAFNRKATTLRCLAQLTAQTDVDDVRLRIVLTDDGSTDGTMASVRSSYPQVTVLEGDGSLYWNGGMLLADAEAWSRRPIDYLLWLNDDVELRPTALRTLLDAADACDRKSIIVGAVSDPASGRSSYGAYLRTDRRRPLKLARLEPNGEVQTAHTMNGNVVLVPSAVRQAIGPTDSTFSHNMADMDYAYRARSAGWGVALAPEFVGSCTPNASKARWHDPSVRVRERIQVVLSVKALPPREWWTFTRRHCGWRWPRYFVSPYLRAVLCGVTIK